MELKIGEIIELDDNKEYIVLKTLEKDNINYVLLMTKNKPIEMLLLKEQIIGDNINLLPIEDQNEIISVIDLLK